MTTAVKSRGIIFRGDMVRAILAGAKSQTRRVVRMNDRVARWNLPGAGWAQDHDGKWCFPNVAPAIRLRCPYGVPGDELWVRETFQSGRGLMACAHVDQLGFPVLPDEATKAPPWVYSADGASLPPGLKWRSSRFMPREASRLTLVVESVRVERLSAISNEDAIAEGVRTLTKDGSVMKYAILDKGDMSSTAWADMERTPRAAYLRAFRAMHKLAADADPWLWVIGFRRKGGAS